MQRKQNNFARKFDNVRVCGSRLYELQPLTALDVNDVHHHHSLCSTSQLFSKGRITASKEVKTIINRGMCSFKVMAMGRLSALSTPVAGSVMSHCVVFLIVFSLLPLTEQLHINGQTLYMKKYYLDPHKTCVIQGI